MKESLHKKLKTRERRGELLRLIEEEGMTIKDAVKHCASWGIKTSDGAVSRFRQAYGFTRKLELAVEAAEIAEKSAPVDWSDASKRMLGKKMFTLVASNDASPKEILAAKNLEIKEQALDHEREKFRAALRSKLETGLDALREEIKNNPTALAIFEQLKTTLQAKN